MNVAMTKERTSTENEPSLFLESLKELLRAKEEKDKPVFL